MFLIVCFGLIDLAKLEASNWMNPTWSNRCHIKYVNSKHFTVYHLTNVCFYSGVIIS